MKLHLITVALAVAVSACASNSRSEGGPRPQVDYMTETNYMACYIEPDPVKRTTCTALTRRNMTYCASIVDEAQRNFCIAAVRERLKK